MLSTKLEAIDDDEKATVDSLQTPSQQNMCLIIIMESDWIVDLCFFPGTVIINYVIQTLCRCRWKEPVSLLMILVMCMQLQTT